MLVLPITFQSGENATALVAVPDPCYAYVGWMYVTPENGKVTGGIMFLSARQNDYSIIVKSRCLCNQVPLEDD